MPIPSSEIDHSCASHADFSKESTKNVALPADIEDFIGVFEEDNVTLYPLCEEKIRSGFASIRIQAQKLVDAGYSKQKILNIVNSNIVGLQATLLKECDSRSDYERNYAMAEKKFTEVMATPMIASKVMTVASVSAAVVALSEHSHLSNSEQRAYNKALSVFDQAYAPKSPSAEKAALEEAKAAHQKTMRKQELPLKSGRVLNVLSKALVRVTTWELVLEVASQHVGPKSA